VSDLKVSERLVFVAQSAPLIWYSLFCRWKELYHFFGFLRRYRMFLVVFIFHIHSVLFIQNITFPLLDRHNCFQHLRLCTGFSNFVLTFFINLFSKPGAVSGRSQELALKKSLCRTERTRSSKATSCS
jgi:hypothetical protein